MIERLVFGFINFAVAIMVGGYMSYLGITAFQALCLYGLVGVNVAVMRKAMGA